MRANINIGIRHLAHTASARSDRRPRRVRAWQCAGRFALRTSVTACLVASHCSGSPGAFRTTSPISTRWSADGGAASRSASSAKWGQDMVRSAPSSRRAASNRCATTRTRSPGSSLRGSGHVEHLGCPRRSQAAAGSPSARASSFARPRVLAVDRASARVRGQQSHLGLRAPPLSSEIDRTAPRPCRRRAAVAPARPA